GGAPAWLGMSSLTEEVGSVARGAERARDELRRAAAWKEVRQDLVISGPWQCNVDRPRSVRSLFGVDVLEIVHVLADDEKVIQLVVHELELRDLLAGARVEHFEEQHDLPACRDDARHRLELQPVVAHVKGSREDEIHPAAG